VHVHGIAFVASLALFRFLFSVGGVSAQWLMVGFGVTVFVFARVLFSGLASCIVHCLEFWAFFFWGEGSWAGGSLSK
jgi:hypothetical protein